MYCVLIGLVLINSYDLMIQNLLHMHCICEEHSVLCFKSFTVAATLSTINRITIQRECLENYSIKSSWQKRLPNEYILAVRIPIVS